MWRMTKYTVRFWGSGLFVAAVMVATWNIEWFSENKVTRVKPEIAGVRQIHQLIKTRTGTEEITYPEGYLAKEFFKSQHNRPLQSARVTNDIPWVERGPGNIGGRSRSILVDSSDPSGNSWLIGTAGGGIWKTQDAGLSWLNVSTFFPNLSIVSLAQSPSNPLVMYAGSGEGGLGGNFVNGIGIFKSIDGGDTWSLLPSTAPTESSDFQNTNRIIVHPENEDILYAATSSGARQSFAAAVLKSQDGGITWEKILSPPGLAQQILFDPESPSTLYVSSIVFGVIKSTDAGETWDLTELADVVTEAGADPERTELAIAPTDPDIIYASVSYRNRSGSGLYRSTDKAETWMQVLDPAEPETDFLIQGEFDNCIIVDPSDAQRVFFGGVQLYEAVVTGEVDSASNRVFAGVDEEGTASFLDFTRFSSGTHFNNSMQIANPGATPTIELRFGNKSQRAHRFVVPEGATSGVQDGQYAYADYVEIPFEVWDTDNDRQLMVSFRDQQRDSTFNLNEAGLDSEESTNREYLFLHDQPYDTIPSEDIAVDGGHTTDQYMFIWPTLASGATWVPEDLPTSILRINFGSPKFLTADITLLNGNRQVHNDHHALAYSAGNRLISVNDGGVGFTTDDGDSFEERELGLVTTQYYSIDRHPTRKIYLGGAQDNDVHLSFSENPTSTSSYDDNVFRDFFADGFDVTWNADGDRLLASNQHNFIFRSDNGGRDWEESTNGLTDSDIFGENANTPFFTKLAYSKFGPDRVFAVSDRGVWRSEDFGESWQLRSIAAGFSGALDVEVSDVDVDIVWAGGSLEQGRRVFVSIDGGDNFEPANFYEEFPSKGNITTIEVDPTDAQTAYLLFSQPAEPKILKTTDLGQSWLDISGFQDGVSTTGFPDVGVFSLLVFPDGQRIWAGTELGIYETMDGGESWIVLESDLPAVAIWDLRVVDGEILAGTHGRGLWSADMELVYDAIEVQRPLSLDPTQEVSLQLYPNPSSGSFRIQGADELSTIEVWSVSGQLVERFDEGLRPDRMYSVSGSKGLHIVRASDGQSHWDMKLVIE